MKKTIKLELLPMKKVPFLKGQKVPDGTTVDDYTFVSIKIGSKPDMTLIGAKFEPISDNELTALVFQSVTEALYRKHHDEDKVIVDGQEKELTQVLQWFT